ncbi:hypothetical protein lerEdw1_020699 [Lerista edwardsae]|nr:hypothetical protein lerEdw1_020699 [Lerista edwardsae]
MQYAELHPKHVNVTGIFPPFTVFVYVCKAGFRRNPDLNDTVICMETIWTFVAEPCAPSCSTPDPLRNSHVPREILVRNFYPVGIVVTYECNEGYLNVSQPSTTTCQSSLQWTQATVFCQGDCYSRDMPILNYSQPASFYNDSTVVPPLTLMLYECKPGFYRNPIMNDHIFCFEMVWRIDGDLCGPSCLQPPKIRFAEIQEKVPIDPYFPPGSEFTYKCINGYDLKNNLEPASVVCQKNLKWSEAKEFCEAIILPETTELKIRNAKIVRGEKPVYSPGDTVTVKCMPGFTLNGEAVIEYVGGNEWSPRLPSCSLNAIVSTFVAVAVMGFVALLSFGAYKTYSSRISPSQPGPITASKSTIGARPSKITATKSTASKIAAVKSTASKAAVSKKASAFRV